MNAFPGRGHFDQHPVFGDALGLVHGDQAFAPGNRGSRIKTEPRIDLGRNPARNDGQDFAAEMHQQMVHHLVQWPATVGGDFGVQQRRVFGFLYRFENQRGVGGGVLGLVGAELLEVTGVGDHGGVLFECVELVHSGPWFWHGSWFQRATELSPGPMKQSYNEIRKSRNHYSIRVLL